MTGFLRQSFIDWSASAQPDGLIPVCVCENKTGKDLVYFEERNRKRDITQRENL